MPSFVCPACRQRTISMRRKMGATSFEPARCPNCGAQVYPSGKKTYLLRSIESLIVTMIVILALIEFAWGLVLLALAVVVVMETLVLLLVPLVQLRRTGFG